MLTLRKFCWTTIAVLTMSYSNAWSGRLTSVTIKLWPGGPHVAASTTDVWNKAGRDSSARPWALKRRLWLAGWLSEITAVTTSRVMRPFWRHPAMLLLLPAAADGGHIATRAALHRIRLTSPRAVQLLLWSRQRVTPQYQPTITRHLHGLSQSDHRDGVTAAVRI